MDEIEDALHQGDAERLATLPLNGQSYELAVRVGPEGVNTFFKLIPI